MNRGQVGKTEVTERGVTECGRCDRRKDKGLGVVLDDGVLDTRTMKDRPYEQGRYKRTDEKSEGSPEMNVSGRDRRDKSLK